MKLILLCGRSKLTWFLYAGPKSLGFSASMQIDVNFVRVVQIDVISVWGIELDLIPDEILLVVVCVVENDFILVR